MAQYTEEKVRRLRHERAAAVRRARVIVALALVPTSVVARLERHAELMRRIPKL